MAREGSLDDWQAKNIQTNTGNAIEQGQHVEDRWGNKGQVTQVSVWEGEANHRNPGAIRVDLENGQEEIYPWYDWEKNLRITGP